MGWVAALLFTLHSDTRPDLVVVLMKQDKAEVVKFQLTFTYLRA